MLYTIEAGRERQNCKLTELELGCADLMKMKFMIDGFFLIILRICFMNEWFFSGTKRIYCSNFQLIMNCECFGMKNNLDYHHAVIVIRHSKVELEIWKHRFGKYKVLNIKKVLWNKFFNSKTSREYYFGVD